MQKGAAALLAALAVVTVACGRSDSDPDTTSIDQINSGNYPTTPIDTESLRNPDSGPLRESIRIGSHTPIPLEYDSRFEYGSIFGYKQSVTKANPPEFSKAEITAKKFNAEIPGLIAGWRTFGQRRYWPDYGKTIETFTLRFEKDSDAEHAARKLVERIPGDEYRIEGHPGVSSRVLNPILIPAGSIESWVAVDDILVYIRALDSISRPFDPAELAAITRKFFDKQLEMLEDYERTPLQDIPNLPMDIDGLLSRALHSDEGDSQAAVYPAHVALSSAFMTKSVSLAFADAGVDLMAVGSTHIYRARDAKGAERLLAALTNGAIDMTSLRPAESPPELPGAVCFEKDPDDTSSKRVQPQCFIAVGRHVARIGGANPDDVHQRTGAQYKLLAPIS